jgi:hypothetical protein
MFQALDHLTFPLIRHVERDHQIFGNRSASSTGGFSVRFDRAARDEHTSARGTSAPTTSYGNGWIMRCQLNGPKELPLSRPTLAPRLTLSLSHSILAVLPWTTMRWKFGTL